MAASTSVCFCEREKCSQLGHGRPLGPAVETLSRLRTCGVGLEGQCLRELGEQVRSCTRFAVGDLAGDTFGNVKWRMGSLGTGYW
jgi:hypothetical protein